MDICARPKSLEIADKMVAAQQNPQPKIEILIDALRDGFYHKMLIRQEQVVLSPGWSVMPATTTSKVGSSAENVRTSLHALPSNAEQLSHKVGTFLGDLRQAA